MIVTSKSKLKSFKNPEIYNYLYTQ